MNIKLTDAQRLVGSFVLIVSLSITMHIFVFSRRKGPAIEHYPVAYPNGQATPGDQFVATGPPVEGKVVIIGTDRFYMQTPEGRQMFFYGNLPHPDFGDHIRVTYAQGTPPTVVKIEKL